MQIKPHAPFRDLMHHQLVGGWVPLATTTSHVLLLRKDQLGVAVDTITHALVFLKKPIKWYRLQDHNCSTPTTHLEHENN